MIYGFNLGNGTTIYQGDNRYSLKNIRFWQNKIEYKNMKTGGEPFIFYNVNDNKGEGHGSDKLPKFTAYADQVGPKNVARETFFCYNS